MGITVSSCSKHTLILMAVVLHEVGDRFKMAQNQVATFLRFSIKSAAPPSHTKKKKGTYYVPPVSLIFGIIQGNKSKHTLYRQGKKNCIFSA